MWSIGMYSGNSPLNLQPHPEASNPVLLPGDISDLKGVSIADPFMIQIEDIWYMFFEVLDGDTQKGSIGLATSVDAIKWTYDRIVLDEQVHLSYPCVFRVNQENYMIPETVTGDGISLYRAERFPYEWTLDRVLVEGTWADPSIFRFEGRWWMFACGTPAQSDSLHLFHSKRLFGPWEEHCLSPLVTDNNRHARPAGRVTPFEDGVMRFCQDCEPEYGTRVRAFEIIELSYKTYREREHHLSPILVPSGEGWNSNRMHHVDPHQRAPGEWIACVDGLTNTSFK